MIIKKNKSVKSKILIRYGKEYLLDYENKLKKRPTPHIKSILMKEYWISFGYSNIEAQKKNIKNTII